MKKIVAQVSSSPAERRTRVRPSDPRSASTREHMASARVQRPHPGAGGGQPHHPVIITVTRSLVHLRHQDPARVILLKKAAKIESDRRAHNEVGT